MSKKDYIFIKKGTAFVKIFYKDIAYITSAKDYCIIVQENESYWINITIAKLSSKMPKNGFYRCHRSYIVNIDRIVSIKGSSAYVGSKEVPISKHHMGPLLKKLNFLSKYGN